ARGSNLGGGRSGRRRGCWSSAFRGTLPSGSAAAAAHRSGSHHTRLPDAFAVGHFAAHLDDELLVPVAEACGERIGCFGIVIDTELAAEGHRRLGPRGIAECPARDTGFVHTLVPDVAVAGIPEPVPVIRKALLVEGPHWCGAEEQIPIQARRR